MTKLLQDADGAFYQDSMRAINSSFKMAGGSVFHISGNVYISSCFLAFGQIAVGAYILRMQIWFKTYNN